VLVASLDLFPRRAIDDATDQRRLEGTVAFDGLSRPLAGGRLDFAFVGPRIFFRDFDLGGELLPSGWGRRRDLRLGLGRLAPDA